MRRFLLACLSAMALWACSGEGGPIELGFGANPTLPEPRGGLIPTLNIQPAIGWPAGATPTAPQGFAVAAFAAGLDHPRWLYVLPNGDVLVAEASSRPGKVTGIRSFFQNRAMKEAGSTGDSADRITLLRDADGDGTAETRSVLVENLNQPFGMAWRDGRLYVANTDALVSFPFTPGETRIEAAPQRVMALPYWPPDNRHWTRNLLLSPDGSKMYITVGSASNVAENGMQAEEGRAAIHEYDFASGRARIFASGLRNPNGLAWEPVSGALWTAVNERDEIGDDLVPDYMTSVRDGAFYGWPYSYWGQHVDERVKPPRPDLVATAVAPDYGLGAHTASLGLIFYTANVFPEHYREGAFVAQHGSWNRAEPSGYKVVYVPFANGRPSGQPEDFLTGFLDAEDRAKGRPVGLAVDRTGAVLVADDVGDVIWRVASDAAPAVVAEGLPSRRN